jgi:hypothetical protein
VQERDTAPGHMTGGTVDARVAVFVETFFHAPMLTDRLPHPPINDAHAAAEGLAPLPKGAVPWRSHPVRAGR